MSPRLPPLFSLALIALALDYSHLPRVSDDPLSERILPEHFAELEEPRGEETTNSTPAPGPDGQGGFPPRIVVEGLMQDYQTIALDGRRTHD